MGYRLLRKNDSSKIAFLTVQNLRCRCVCEREREKERERERERGSIIQLLCGWASARKVWIILSIIHEFLIFKGSNCYIHSCGQEGMSNVPKLGSGSGNQKLES